MEIFPVRVEELPAISTIYSHVISYLRANKIEQWNRWYPNRFIIRTDLKQGHLFRIMQETKYIGVIVLNQKQSGKYGKLDWEEKGGNPLCIHRLAVHPEHQGKGIGKKLLTFAEEYAGAHGYSSIRLDVFTENPAAVNMYERAGYKARGKIHFPFRSAPYLCMEKILD